MPAQAELLFSYDQVLPALDKRAVVTLTPFTRQMPDFRPKALVKVNGLGASAYQGNMRELSRDLQKWRKDGWRVALFAGGVARGQRLNRTLFDFDCDAPFLEKPAGGADARRGADPALLAVPGLPLPGRQARVWSQRATSSASPSTAGSRRPEAATR